MKKLKLLAGTAAVAFAALLCLADGTIAAEKKRVVIKGSTTVLPIVQKAAEDFRKNNRSVSITVSGDGSGNGIKALIDGIADIATSSREMKPEERKKAADKKIKVKEIVVAYDMIVPIVHPSNPLVNLSAAQLKGIYDGSIKNWKDVGGPDETIVAISRDTSSGTYEIWEEKIMKKTKVRPDALLQASNGAIVSTVAGNKKAIGYIGFGYLAKSIKPLKINDVIGTIENGKSGKFPVSRKLYLYINEETLSAETKAYIDFLQSAEGQRVVKDTGFIPLK